MKEHEIAFSSDIPNRFLDLWVRSVLIVRGELLPASVRVSMPNDIVLLTVI